MAGRRRRRKQKELMKRSTMKWWVYGWMGLRLAAGLKRPIVFHVAVSGEPHGDSDSNSNSNDNNNNNIGIIINNNLSEPLSPYFFLSFI